MQKHKSDFAWSGVGAGHAANSGALSGRGRLVAAPGAAEL